MAPGQYDAPDQRKTSGAHCVGQQLATYEACVTGGAMKAIQVSSFGAEVRLRRLGHGADHLHGEVPPVAMSSRARP